MKGFDALQMLNSVFITNVIADKTQIYVYPHLHLKINMLKSITGSLLQGLSCYMFDNSSSNSNS